MKRVAVVLLTLALALGAITSFATPDRGWYYSPVTFDKAAGVIGESFNDPAISSEINEIREDWTQSRGLGLGAATFVNRATGKDDMDVAVKINSTEYMTGDYIVDGNMLATVDLKAVKLGEFCGIAIDVDTAGLGSGNTEFGCSHPNTVLYSGYGFTLINSTTLRAFVYASPTGSVDAYDFALGFDAGADYHTYALYKDADESTTYIAVDGVQIGYFAFDESLGDQIGIYNAQGEGVALDTNNGMYGSACVQGGIIFAVVGADTEIYMDNIGYTDTYEAIPEPADPETDPEPDPEPSETKMHVSKDQIYQNLDQNANYIAPGQIPSDTPIAVDGTNIEVITTWGWVALEKEIAAFGYSINGGDIVWGDFAVAAEQPVLDAAASIGCGYASRYRISATVYKGEDVAVKCFVKAADGEIIDMGFDYTYSSTTGPDLPGQNPPPPPQTADASMVVFMVAAAAIVVTVVLAKKKEF